MAKSKKRNQSTAIWLTLFGFVVLTLITALLLRGKDVILVNPKGMVAHAQFKLMLHATLIMLVIGVPTLFALYFFAWKYRETNHKATYTPEPRHRSTSALVIWILPTIIMLVLAGLMLPATQKLEPQKPIESDKQTLKIQVVAMRWKWLFIYPEQQIATVNYVQIPVDTPVQFELTADETPMSSFWIPHLGGQLYAMTEHVNRLNLLADTQGDFQGSVAEINGAGFAGMRFVTRVGSQQDFDAWVEQTQRATDRLDTAAYETLLKPSENHATMFYSSPDPTLYGSILKKYGGSADHQYAEHEGH